MKHKLDEEVEDILQHYGIKGMRWDVRRTQEEIAADAQAGVDAVGEALDSDEANELRERFGDLMDDGKELISKFSKKLSKVDDKAIKLGKGLFSKFKNNPISKSFRKMKKAKRDLAKLDRQFQKDLKASSRKRKAAYDAMIKGQRARKRMDLAERNYDKASLRNDPVVGTVYRRDNY